MAKYISFKIKMDRCDELVRSYLFHKSALDKIHYKLNGTFDHFFMQLESMVAEYKILENSKTKAFQKQASSTL